MKDVAIMLGVGLLLTALFAYIRLFSENWTEAAKATAFIVSAITLVISGASLILYGLTP